MSGRGVDVRNNKAENTDAGAQGGGSVGNDAAGKYALENRAVEIAVPQGFYEVPQLPKLPALVNTMIVHQRFTPIKYRLRTNHDQWLVDIRDLPNFSGWRWLLGVVREKDHQLNGSHLAGSRDLTEQVSKMLADNGMSLAKTDRVLLLANPYSLGNVFDPLSVFWVVDAENLLRAVILEVRNTYGGKHPYLLVPDQRGQTSVEKVFYVSPFNDVTGSYAVKVRLTKTQVMVRVTLSRNGVKVFDAVSAGRLRPLTKTSALRSAIFRPAPGWRVPVLIKLHGIRLWLARLPIQKRPENHLAPNFSPKHRSGQNRVGQNRSGQNQTAENLASDNLAGKNIADAKPNSNNDKYQKDDSK